MIKNAKWIMLVFSAWLFCNAIAYSLFLHPDQQAQLEQVAGHKLLKTFAVNGDKMAPPVTPLIRVIFQDKEGVFWFGGRRGICAYDEKRDKWIDHTNALGNGAMTSVHSIGQDPQGRVWVCYGISRKFALFDGNLWRDAGEILPQNLKSLGGYLITGRNGEMWFISPQGIILYDGSNWAGPFNPPQKIQQSFVQIKPTDDSDDSENAASANLSKRAAHDEALQAWTSEVWSGLQDRDGALWLGGINTLIRFDERAGQWEVYPVKGLSGLVSHISEDRYGRLWLADVSGHLAAYDKSKKVWVSYNLGQRFPQIKPTAETVYVDKQGQVLIGIEPGIVVVNQNNGEMIPILAARRDSQFYWVTAIKEDNQGRIWIASYDGISILKQ